MYVHVHSVRDQHTADIAVERQYIEFIPRPVETPEMTHERHALAFDEGIILRQSEPLLPHAQNKARA